MGYSQLVSMRTPQRPSTSSSVDLVLLLNCIAEVESGNDDTKIGKHGERSRYQISKIVWNKHYRAYDFVRFCSGSFAKSVAFAHLNWLDQNLSFKGTTEKHFREYSLAWAWRSGLESWNHFPYGHVTRIELNNYAVRVTNLYDERRRSQ